MGQLLLFFLYNFCSFFSYVGGVLVTKLFSLLLTDRYIFGYSANYNTWGAFVILFLIFWTASETLTSWSLQQKAAKIASESFSLGNSSWKLPFSPVLMYTLYGDPRYFKFNRKYQQYGPCFQTIFSFLWLWPITAFRSVNSLGLNHNQLII